MISILPPAVMFGLLAACVTTLGLVAVAFTGSWARTQSGVVAAFAAGALICVIILHLLPEAISASPSAPVFMLVGFAAAYLINRGVFAFATGPVGEKLAGGLAPMLAIGLHSFLDGASYSVTFSFDWHTGAITALGLIAHEVPEGIIVFTLLRTAGFSPSHAFWLAFASAAATTPLGAVLSQPVVSQLTPDVLGNVFALVAGLLLYVGAGHLLPHVEREPAIKALPALGLGAVVAIGAMQLNHGAHDHAHGEHADHTDHDDHAGHDHSGHDHDDHHGHVHPSHPHDVSTRPDFRPDPTTPTPISNPASPQSPEDPPRSP